MMKLSTPALSAREVIPSLVLVALIAATAGCGSNSRSSSPTPEPAVEGVATPSSVAVVSATNAE